MLYVHLCLQQVVTTSKLEEVAADLGILEELQLFLNIRYMHP